MMSRVLLGCACALVLAACSEPSRTTDGMEGAYGASSGPNANDPDATVAAQDQNPAYDEPETAAGSEFGEHMPSAPDSNEPDRATATPP